MAAPAVHCHVNIGGHYMENRMSKNQYHNDSRSVQRRPITVTYTLYPDGEVRKNLGEAGDLWTQRAVSDLDRCIEEHWPQLCREFRLEAWSLMTAGARTERLGQSELTPHWRQIRRGTDL